MLWIRNNFFGIAGTSTNPQNQDGWATIAANLGPYLGNYVKINFVLFHADAPGGNVATQTERPGWFIDDVTIGEKYVQDGIMIIKTCNRHKIMMKNHPSGYGLMYVDSSFNLLTQS